MIGWLITLGYAFPALGTWIAGAVRIGEQSTKNLKAKSADYSFQRAEYWNPLYVKFFSALGAGLLWPLGLPVYLAFNKGKSLGIKKKQMQKMLDEQEAEIKRIKQQEGWK